MSTATIKRYSLDEYFAHEEMASRRHEYYDGEIFAMPGGSDRHGSITVMAVVSLHAALSSKVGYRIYGGDTSFSCPTGLFTFPDAAVIRGPSDPVRHHGIDSMRNPLLIVEVLSGSTEAYDRGDKFEHYKTIPTLQGYLLVTQSEPRLEHFTRQPNDRWQKTEVEGIDARIELPELDITLPLASLYSQVTFPPTDEDSDPAEQAPTTEQHPPAPKQ